MIKKPTVLVLGAGASMPYGFPSGRGLLLEIVDGLTYQPFSLLNILLEMGHTRARLEEFRDALGRSMQPSVDAFLEKRPEFLEIGKAAIAGTLIPLENENVLKRYPRDDLKWYEYLFKHLDAPAEHFGENRLSVVTFNYDRSLEHFLLMAICDSYGLVEEWAFGIFKEIPIVHLYGSLGKYSHDPEVGRRYSSNLSPAEIQEAASSIKIMSERQDGSDEFRQAHEFFKQAEMIAIIGFGYQEDNLRRLSIRESSKSAPIYGTAYQLGDNERKQAAAFMHDRGTLQLTPKEIDALDFLRNMPVFD